ncbi:hypothetical protein OPV22_001321 [Ensete ventricosum]|uniref:Ig-like domain-containing protein n=1 Tax=Ensete ventricosum TaxID=4639 RepID=A0AAV8RUC0_ENSVE|nr:hypothetical protein OPV22_001321 [Ensete ventricosum]
MSGVCEAETGCGSTSAQRLAGGLLLTARLRSSASEKDLSSWIVSSSSSSSLFTLGDGHGIQLDCSIERGKGLGSADQEREPLENLV